MEKGKISVIIPLYNTARFLERCVASVACQSYTNLEIIIVDDGSTDGSGELAERLAEKDERLKVIHQENGGASVARNRGIAEATGEYFGFVDSDDYIEPEMYASLLAMLEREDLSIAQASRQEIDQLGQPLPDICQPPEKETVVDSAVFFRELLLHRGDASLCTKLIKASLLADERFPEGVINEDFHLLIRLLPKAGRIGLLPEYCYHVVYHDDSTTRKREKDSVVRGFVDHVDNADMIEELVKTEHPELVSEAKRFALFQRLEYLLCVPISQMRRDNAFYRKVIRYLRHNKRHTISNPYLTRQNKLYLLLFTLAPRAIRRVHATLFLKR
jgi:glycosyltransferase involved in cell wall biosynthesis